MFIDSKCLRQKELKIWWSKLQKDEPLGFRSITGGLPNSLVNPFIASKDSPTAALIKNDRDNFKLCEELATEVRNMGFVPASFTKFYKISGFVKTIFNDDKIMYLSCPDCRKKVIEEASAWRCEHCSRTYNTNLPTYMLSALINDVSGSVMV